MIEGIREVGGRVDCFSLGNRLGVQAPDKENFTVQTCTIQVPQPPNKAIHH
jgi:hypothetical protein